MSVRAVFIAIIASLFSLAATAETPELVDPATPEILPLRERAKLRDEWLRIRLDTVIPMIMREQGVDMWILIAREYNEDPVVRTMLPATWLGARRRTILLFHNPGGDAPSERLAVSRYPVGDVFPAAWDPETQPDQWARLAEIIAEHDPKRIAVNVSSLFALADGLTHSQMEEMRLSLPPKYRARLENNEHLATRWLETRIPAEMAAYPSMVRIAHSIIAEAMSENVITPGETTTQDVVWWMRQRVADLGLDTWFHPSVTIQRQNAGPLKKESLVQAEARSNDNIIQYGDFLHTDFGITYMGLNTDTQHHAYVLQPGEATAPKGLQDGLAAANRVQDHLTQSFKRGRTSNEILAMAREASIKDGLRPSIYSHQIGFYGHGPSSPIGWWDNQKADHPMQHRPLQANTAWSIELNATHAVPEWNDQDIVFKTEEDAYFDGSKVEYLDGRQTQLHLIPRPAPTD